MVAKQGNLIGIQTAVIPEYWKGRLGLQEFTLGALAYYTC